MVKIEKKAASHTLWQHWTVAQAIIIFNFLHFGTIPVILWGQTSWASVSNYTLWMLLIPCHSKKGLITKLSIVATDEKRSITSPRGKRHSHSDWGLTKVLVIAGNCPKVTTVGKWTGRRESSHNSKVSSLPHVFFLCHFLSDTRPSILNMIVTMTKYNIDIN